MVALVLAALDAAMKLVWLWSWRWWLRQRLKRGGSAGGGSAGGGSPSGKPVCLRYSNSQRGAVHWTMRGPRPSSM